MADNSLAAPDPSDAETPLHSWKEIAAYLNRDVSTVKRWERHEGLPRCRRERAGVRLHQARRRLVQASGGHALVFPLRGELAGHAPMVGRDHAGVAGRPCRFLRRPRSALVPQPLAVLPVRLETRRRLQRPRAGGGGERGEAPLTDQGLDRLPGEIWALVPALGGGPPRARGALQGAGAPRTPRPPPVASATDQPPRPPGWALPDGAPRLSTGAMGFEAGAMLCVRRPGARGWHRLCAEGRVRVAGARDPPSTRAAGWLRAGIDLALARGRGAGREWGRHHIGPGPAVGPTPRQWPFDRACPQAYAALPSVLDQGTQARLQWPACLTGAPEQPDHLGDVGRRLRDDLAGGVVARPHRQREAACTPARLLQGALRQAWREERQCRLTPGPFASS